MFKMRRFYSSGTSASASAKDVAAAFLSSHAGKEQLQTQLLDANQLQRLNATLARPSSHLSPKTGSVIPPCYHLAYFTPSQVEKDLGGDGSDTSFNPPGKFTRRMWAGGELEWISGEQGRLRIGNMVTERTRLVSAEGKTTRTGEEMVVVGVEKIFENEKEVGVVDRRNWIFRPLITSPSPPSPKPMVVPFPSGTHTKDIIQTPVSLFRFSALTFNGHKIHYNREWCQQVEGHRDLVVHGPLNLINMVDFWRDVIGDGERGQRWPKKIVYRATSPLYAGERYRIVMDEEKEGLTSLRIIDNYGKVSMVGTIEREL